MDLIIKAVVEALKRMCKETVEEIWMTASYSLNSGQTTLFHRNILPTIDAWKDELDDTWPYTDGSVFEAYIYSCYDMEVMERAFSETTDTCVPEIDDLAGLAELIQDMGGDAGFDVS